MSSHIKVSTIEAEEQIVLMTIRGSLDTVVVFHLQEQVETLINAGHYKFLINLQELEHISSAGVGLFSAIILDLERHHGKVVFINIPEQVYDILKLTHLIEIFTIAQTQEEAIALLESP
ncbi:anti-sigma factor antagonist [Candidatus Vecturithrix granuli]|uniref:Anti-sigma factor antagonist n=1 Tax=Vecturithrix granuli TaxID=1499967 RepID=A0A081BX02_VECG1|nr:anti-sigma factor antagonist [Candidatus Vecturithrix granuli]